MFRPRHIIILAVCIVAAALAVALLFFSPFHKRADPETSLAEPAPGFFMPSASSIPEGFQEAGHQYDINGYQLRYLAPTISPLTALLITEETGNIAQTEKQLDFFMGSRKPLKFTYENSLGEVYSMPMYLTQTGAPSGFMDYTLMWDDGGNALEISLTAVPDNTFSEQDLVNMLKTFTRS